MLRQPLTKTASMRLALINFCVPGHTPLLRESLDASLAEPGELVLRRHSINYRRSTGSLFVLGEDGTKRQFFALLSRVAHRLALGVVARRAAWPAWRERPSGRVAKLSCSVRCFCGLCLCARQQQHEPRRLCVRTALRRNLHDESSLTTSSFDLDATIVCINNQYYRRSTTTSSRQSATFSACPRNVNHEIRTHTFSRRVVLASRIDDLDTSTLMRQ